MALSRDECDLVKAISGLGEEEIRVLIDLARTLIKRRVKSPDADCSQKP